MKAVDKVALWSLVAVALLCTACTTTPKVRVDKDATMNFSNYKSFTWFVPPTDTLKAEPQPIAAAAELKSNAKSAVDTITENRVRAVLIGVLQSKGYQLNEATPDFRVSYMLSVYERPKKSGVSLGVGAGGGSGHVSGGVGLSIPLGKRTNTMVTMTIDIIDTARNAQVWTGSYEERMPVGPLSDADANKLVTTILARFPTDASK